MSRLLPGISDGAGEGEAKAFTIRRVREGDEADIYRLLRGDESTLPKDDPRHPAREAERLVATSFEVKPQGMGWLAIDAQGVAAGIITTKEGFNGGIYVDENHRRMGIAESLVLAREEFMRERGDTQAQAHIRADNAPSIRLHSKLGYEFDEKSAGDPTEKPGDTILVMVKSLVDAPASPSSAPKQPKPLKPG